jgi:hypothetical protein
MVYDTVDAYNTTFAPGCMDQTRAKVAAGKVKLFVAADQGFHQYGTRTHVGTLRSLVTVGNQEIATADIFDTADGRALKEYLSAVMASGSETGCSIGFYPRDSETVPAPSVPGSAGPDMMSGTVTRFTEIELEELSITPINAVPGADVLAVRAHDPAALERAVTAMVPLLTPDAKSRILPLVQPAPAAGRSATDEVPTQATDEAATTDERLLAYRSLFSDPRSVSCPPKLP